MRKSFGLRQQFFAIAAGGMVLMGLALGSAVGMVAGDQVKRDLGQELAELAFHMSDKLDRGMWARQGEVALLAENQAIRTPTDPTEARRLLNRQQANVPLFSWIGLLAPDGHVVAATGGILEGQNISHRPVYREAKDSLFIGDVHDAKLLAEKLPNPKGEPMRFVDISQPLHDDTGRLIGILATHLSWSWAREIEETLVGGARHADDIELFIVNTKGEVLLSPGDQGVFSTLDLQSIALAADNNRGWMVERWPDGRRYLTGYAREQGYKSYPGLGWTILARRPVESAFLPVWKLQVTIATIGGVFAVGFALAFWVLAGTVTRPLRKLADAADELATKGDGVLPQLGGADEIHRLSASLRALVLALTSSENRAARMQDLAHRDRLTGLANRAALDALLGHLLPEARRNQRPVACLYLDLDGFKPVNDTLGHQAGDRVLQVVAERLRTALRGQDVPVRLGGDEFVAVLTIDGDDWRGEARACATRIIAALTDPIDVDGGSAKVGTSIGIAAWPEHGNDFAQVMAKADEALYQAKRGGKNRAAFAD